MIDPELKQFLERRFAVADEQYESLLKATKGGFDAMDDRFNAVNDRFNSVDDRFNSVDDRFNTIEQDIEFLKQRVSDIADEVRMLSANMVTKQYLETRIETHLELGKMSATKQEAMRQALLALMLLLEKQQLLPSEQRAKYEAMLA